jgi:Xaa-Pro aminopeptidase
MFSATFPNSELTDGEAVMRAARRVKSPAEIAYIRAAIAVAEDALGAAVDALRPGVREADLKGVFEEQMCSSGTTTPAYEGAFCVVDHGRPIRRIASDRVVGDGDLVAMSAGVLLDGWEGSLARTRPCGAPSADHHDHASRWNAQWASLVDRCRSGALVGDLRTTTGVAVHGVGCGYEELEDDAVLEPGIVVELELETAGILAADTFLIGDDRLERLTTFPDAAAGE